MTKGHLKNNGGIREHSASTEFKRTGIVRFSMGINPPVKMVKFPNGKEMPAKEYDKNENI